MAMKQRQCPADTQVSNTDFELQEQKQLGFPIFPIFPFCRIVLYQRHADKNPQNADRL
jgi:hypothetical protein